MKYCYTDNKDRWDTSPASRYENTGAALAAAHEAYEAGKTFFIGGFEPPKLDNPFDGKEICKKLGARISDEMASKLGSELHQSLQLFLDRCGAWPEPVIVEITEHVAK